MYYPPFFCPEFQDNKFCNTDYKSIPKLLECRGSIFYVFCPLYFLTLDYPHQDHDDGDDEQNMDETTHGIGRNPSQEPGNDQYQGQSIKHGLRRAGADGCRCPAAK
jgi:hypothetical protein